MLTDIIKYDTTHSVCFFFFLGYSKLFEISNFLLQFFFKTFEKKKRN